MMQENLNEDQIKKLKSTPPKITYQAMMQVCEVIDKLTDDRPPVVMEDCVNDEHEDSIRNYLVEENDTKENNEVREISIDTENKYVKHRDITDNKT